MTLAQEVVCLDAPHHHATQAHRFGVLGLQRQTIHVVVAYPLALVVVGVGRHVVWISDYGPCLWLPHEGLANLVVAQRAGFASVWTRATLLTGWCIDSVHSRFVQGKRAPIGAYTKHDLFRWSSLLKPVVDRPVDVQHSFVFHVMLGRMKQRCVHARFCLPATVIVVSHQVDQVEVLRYLANIVGRINEPLAR